MGSHWEPVVRTSDAMPCVIYCHGNCGSRLDAAEAVDCLLPSNIGVFAFDFSGSGLSDGTPTLRSCCVCMFFANETTQLDAGEYVSLGAYEREDVEAVVAYLRATERVSRIGT